MALLSIQQAHVGAQQGGTDGDTGSAQGQSTGQGSGPATGVDASLIPSSTVQTVYNCGVDDAPLSVCCLDTKTRTVLTATPDNATPVLGVIWRKNSATTAIVVAYGPVSGFTGLEAGQRYFLTHDGGITAPPLSVADAQYIHPVGFAVTGTTLFVMPGWPRLKRADDD
jgi:hypothetical protein